ncbi:MAG: 1,3-beta-galactosyl-N-acetylhexosamine phosphorylase, partial [Clostridiales bacterium]|nr:1,3-beta-galactosyl-N-acetylhexosamine phosphorylase [Clostridiales bacterium]
LSTLAVNQYGKGRGVYIAGLPYSPQNARLLLRAMFWSANKENEMKKAYSSNPITDCAYYPESGKYAIINNSNENITTVFYDCEGKEETISIKAGDIVWKK